VAVELGSDNGIVVQRPQGSVAEAVVEAVDLFFAQGDRLLVDPIMKERRRIEIRDSWPSDPCTLGVLEDGS
jgi:hypothetical protein